MLNRKIIQKPAEQPAVDLLSAVKGDTEGWIYGLINLDEESTVVDMVNKPDSEVEGCLVLLQSRRARAIKAEAWLIAPGETFTWLVLTHNDEIIARYYPDDINKIIAHLKKKYVTVSVSTMTTYLSGERDPDEIGDILR